MQIIITYFANSFTVGQVVCDDFSQLRKVPAVPFSAAHNVVVKLLIQVVQKTWGDKENSYYMSTYTTADLIHH